MEDYKARFIDFMVDCGALRFGEFVTKSGRQTPYFINSGAYDTGGRLRRLGGFYAAAIHAEMGDRFDLLFGPAYKGIPLAAAAAAALAEDFGHDVPFVFNRKEAKDHGEGGSLIGRPPKPGDRIVLIDDVVTAGTSVRDSAALLTPTGAILAGLAVSVDRQERGTGPKTALAEAAEQFGLNAFAIVTLAEIVGHLHRRNANGMVVLDDPTLERINAYRSRYGVAF